MATEMYKGVGEGRVADGVGAAHGAHRGGGYCAALLPALRPMTARAVARRWGGAGWRGARRGAKPKPGARQSRASGWRGGGAARRVLGLRAG